MLYIQESLAPGEKILKFSQYHFIYVVFSFFGAFLFLLAAFVLMFVGIIYHHYDITKVPPWMIFQAAGQLSFSDYVTSIWHMNIVFRVAAFLCVLMAMIQIGSRMLVRMTTEMGVTTRRVVFKRGMVSRKVEEMRVDFIDGADVEQTIMGRMFNYGRVKMYGTGVEGITFPNLMEDPVNFRRAVMAARAVQIGGAEMPSQPSQLSRGPEKLHEEHADIVAGSTKRDAARIKAEMPITPNGPAISVEELKHVSDTVDETPTLSVLPGAKN